MRLKLQISLIVLALVGLFYYGCVEEPFIEPVKRAWSSIRIGNFTNNVGTMSVSVADENINNVNLNQKTFTQYYDIIASNAKVITVRDANNNIIYSKGVSIESYAEITYIFAGYYSTVDSLNTLAIYDQTEGTVYVDDTTPPPDSCWAYFINASGASPGDDNRELIVTGTINPNDTTARTWINLTGLAVGNVGPVGNIPAGTYDILFDAYVPNSTDTIHFSVTGQIMNSGMRYFYYVTGNPSTPEVVVDEEGTHPVRPK